MPRVNPQEADDWRYATLASVDQEVAARPEDFTAWFKIVLPKVERARERLTEGDG